MTMCFSTVLVIVSGNHQYIYLSLELLNYQKKKKKSYGSVIPPISTKRAINNCHAPLNTKKWANTYHVLNLGPDLGQARTCGGVKPFNGTPNP